MEYHCEDYKKRLENMESFCIFGAGIVAMTVYTAIKERYNVRPEFFLVSEVQGNPQMIDGIVVKSLENLREPDKTIVYLIAIPEKAHEDIVRQLHAREIRDAQMILVNNELENRITGEYYRTLDDFVTGEEALKAISDTEKEKKRVCVFQAKSHKDQILRTQMAMPSYICPIQVGAVLTEQKITSLQDHCGENISYKNYNYCELTATYYAWKNCSADYKGLCHYRRIFDLRDSDLSVLIQKTNTDVILPYPSIYYPNMNAEHDRYIKKDDWEALLRALWEMAPRYYKAYEMMVSANEQFFYNFNMLIAKAEVFDDYCSFLFSVLEYVEHLTAPKGEERADRFAGYMGENLTTIYFRANRDKLKIVHVGKLWLT